MSKEWKCKDASCTRVFTTYNTMYAHWQAKHLNPRFKCTRCGLMFPRHSQRALHYYKHHVSDETGLSELVTEELVQPVKPVEPALGMSRFTVPEEKDQVVYSRLSSYIAF